MDYWRLYQRNVGLFTKEQQEVLRSSKIFIAGVGGVGGIEAATLARFGIGELVIMDPGVFDEPDMNRQFGAMSSTLGQNKAKATARFLQDINPFLKVHVLETAPDDPAVLKLYMEGCSLVIDAIDFLGFDYKVKFARVAREMGLLNITAPIPGFSTLMAIFDPQGMTLEEFYQAPSDPALWPNYRLPLDLILGENRFGNIPAAFRNREVPYITTCAGSASLNGGLVATEVALILSGLRKKEDIILVPQVTYVDILHRVFEVYSAY